MPQPQPLDERLLAFAVRVIKLVEALPKSLAGRRIGDQLLRSGVAIGAHYQESRAAESREDFVHKLQIALKELRESNYWLKVLTQAEILPAKRIADLLAESAQLVAILSRPLLPPREKPASRERTFDLYLLTFDLLFLCSTTSAPPSPATR